MAYNSVLDWFTPNCLKKNWKIDNFLLKDSQNVLNPLFDPGLRFIPNMAPHSNDAAYFPLPSCKKLETFNDSFPRKCLKTWIFDT